MNSQEGIVDKAKLFTAIVLLVAAISGFYYYSEQSTLVRVLGLLITTGVAVAVASQTDIGRVARGFLLDARSEMRKVVWPSRRETVTTAVMVVIMTTLLAIFFFGVDSFFGAIVKFLLSLLG